MQQATEAVDPVRDYDTRRSQCPVSRDARGTWTLYRHDDVRSTALDDATFSSAASRYLQVPNGFDGAEHTAYRSLIDRYFTPARIAALEPTLDAVAHEIVAQTADTQVDAVTLGARFAVRASCAWLGWSPDVEPELLDWIVANREATRSGELTRTASVAEWFDDIVHRAIDERRAQPTRTPADVTAELIQDDHLGRPLTDDEITSILRNWTGGDLGSLALCAGVVLAYVADHPELQTRLRGGVSEVELDAVIDETLRIDNPFVANRRVTTTDTEVRGRHLAQGERVALNWTAANRDPEVFGDPDAFAPEANAPHNIVYGVGRHACPGRTLATMELRLLTQAVLGHTTVITPDETQPRERALPPVGGYSQVPLVLHRT